MLQLLRSRRYYLNDHVLELVGELEAFLRVDWVVVVEHLAEVRASPVVAIHYQLAEVEVLRETVHADATSVLLA